MSDSADRLEELGRSIASHTTGYGESLTTLNEGSAYHDDKRTIGISLGEEGGVSEFSISDAWRSEYGEEMLGAAFSELYSKAAGERLKRFVEEAESSQDGNSGASFFPGGRPEPASSPSMLEIAKQQGSVIDPQRIAAGITSFFDDLLNGMDAVMAAAEEQSNTTFIGSGGGGNVLVRIGPAGDLREVIFREGYLTRKSAFNIANTLNEALADANEKRGEHSFDPFEGTPLAGLQEMVNDPTAMAARLGWIPR